jgi:hypothetical protein
MGTSKALLRILIAELCVNGKADIRPTYRATIPDEEAPPWQGFAQRQESGDGGNRTHVRNRVRMASTSVAGALISSLARLAGGVVGDQPP